MIKRLLKKMKRIIERSEIRPLYYTEELRTAYLGTSVSGGTLCGKTVLVTGATGGIGTGLALRFLREGCHVVISGRNQDKLNDLKSQLLKDKADGCVDTLLMDLQDRSSLDKAIKEIEDNELVIDILINNAGVYTEVDKKRRFRTVKEEEFDTVWKINFEGTVMFTEKIIPLMNRPKGRKTIVNISSICTEYKNFQYTPYGISKSAILKWTELMQLKYPDVKFVAVQPGSVATIMGNLKMGDNIANSSNVLHHPALPEEIAALVAFLASDVGKFVNNSGAGVIASACEVL